MKSIYHIQLDKTRIAIADLCEIDGKMYITRINVPISFRGSGYGSKILASILQDADAEGVTLYLLPSFSGHKSRGIGSRTELIAWYRRHGFEDYSEGGLFRKPKLNSY